VSAEGRTTPRAGDLAAAGSQISRAGPPSFANRAGIYTQAVGRLPVPAQWRCPSDRSFKILTQQEGGGSRRQNQGFPPRPLSGRFVPFAPFVPSCLGPAPVSPAGPCFGPRSSASGADLPNQAPLAAVEPAVFCVLPQAPSAKAARRRRACSFLLPAETRPASRRWLLPSPQFSASRREPPSPARVVAVMPAVLCVRRRPAHLAPLAAVEPAAFCVSPATAQPSEGGRRSARSLVRPVGNRPAQRGWSLLSPQFSASGGDPPSPATVVAVEPEVFCVPPQAASAKAARRR
jgi:hypothetical protein